MKKTLILYDEIVHQRNTNIVFFNEIIKKDYLTKNKITNNNQKNDILESYGLSEDLIYEDAKLLSNIVFEKYIVEISKTLNTFHNINKSKRYWSIILGDWLKDCIYTTYNRYKTLKKGLEDHNIDEIILVEGDNNNFPIIESRTLNRFSGNLFFDACLISIIFKNLENTQQIKEIIFKEKKIVLKPEESIFRLEENKKNAKGKMAIFFSKMMDLFNNNTNDNFFIIEPYLGFVNEIKLNYLLNKKIQRHEYPDIRYDIKKKNPKARSNIKFNSEGNNEFEKILNTILPTLLPLSVVENYHQIINTIENNIKWPVSPKLIFSSNSFGNGGPAQFWIASKVEKGSKYFIGQHGAGYLEHTDKDFRAELKPVDGFISWGKKNSIKKDHSLFNFTQIGKTVNKKKGTKFIIVFKSAGGKTSYYDRVKFSKFLNLKNIELIKQLEPNIRKNTLIRLHPNFKKKLYTELDDYLEKNEDLTVDRSSKYSKLIQHSKLMIFDDYSTGFLHNLNFEYPSILYLPMGYIFINKEIKNDFINLEKNKIIFTNVNNLNEHIKDIWNNPYDWWTSHSTREARREFLKNYSILPPKNALVQLSEKIKNLI
mgnify:CR=1 FL=1